MTVSAQIQFDQAGLIALLDTLDDAALDALDFGVIAFDAANAVRRYSQYESRASGLEPARVMGHDLFEVVAQCFNNYLVAGRFEEAAAAQVELDETIRYVLTWRMKPSRVELRLLFHPRHALRYVLLRRL